MEFTMLSMLKLFLKVGIYSESANFDSPAWGFGICPEATADIELKQIISAQLLTFSATYTVLMIGKLLTPGDEVKRQQEFCANSVSSQVDAANNPQVPF